MSIWGDWQKFRALHAGDLVHVDAAFTADARAGYLISEIEEYLLWEPGRKGHAAAHKRLVEALRIAKEDLRR